MRRPHPFSSKCKTRLSESLRQALLERCSRTGESMDHVIQSALAEELNIEHHTIFQISTSTALVEGVYQGCVSIQDIKKRSVSPVFEKPAGTSKSPAGTKTGDKYASGGPGRPGPP